MNEPTRANLRFNDVDEKILKYVDTERPKVLITPPIILYVLNSLLEPLVAWVTFTNGTKDNANINVSKAVIIELPNHQRKVTPAIVTTKTDNNHGLIFFILLTSYA